MNNAEDYSALRWIKEHLDETIDYARQALEEYVEGNGDPSLLRKCCDSLHQVHGTLRMVQLYGPAMLAEEMEYVAAAMLEGRAQNSREAAEALGLAIVRLPDYLEKLNAGVQDFPLVLLPLLNDLRASRSAPLLTEASLFSPELEHAAVNDKITGEANTDLPEVAHRLRVNYHKGLIGWYRNLDSVVSLERIRDVITELEQKTHTQPAHDLFWVTHAFTEGLIEGTLKPGTAVNSLLGRLDREIKRLMDQGEQALAEDPPTDLLKNLLYYVAQTESENSCVKSVQETFKLDAALPSEAEIETGRANLFAPGADVIDTVRDVIKTDLTQIKDNLDLYIRGDRARTDNLRGLIEPMRQLADTLGMVGKGALRLRLIQQAEKVTAISQSGNPPEEDELMKIAAEILFIESSLTNLGEANEVLAADAEPPPGDLLESRAGALLLPQGEIESVAGVALQEAQLEMLKAKELIAGFFESPSDVKVLAEVPRRLRSVGGALTVLSHPEPAEMLGVVSGFLQREIIGRGKLPENAQLSALADVIAGVEFYMEAVHEKRGNSDQLLDVARAAVVRLSAGSAPVHEPTESKDLDAAKESEDEIEHAQEAEEVEHRELTDEHAVNPQPELHFFGLESSGELERVDVTAVRETDDLDQDVLEIFLEEAKEELANIQQHLGLWKNDPDAKEALAMARRSFHTLKGSGRLVGANALGEFAWSMENLLNRLMDGTIEATPEVVSIVDGTLRTLPEFLTKQASGQLQMSDVQSLMDRAFGAAVPDLVAEEEPEEVYELFTEEESAPESTSKADGLPELQLDEIEEVEITSPEFATKGDVSAPGIFLEPELFEIFRLEATNHLDYLQDFIRTSKAIDTPVFITEGVYRALHTLHGSANAAEVDAIANVSKALEKLASVMMESKQRVDARVIGLLDDGVGRMLQQLRSINAPGTEMPESRDLVERIDALREELSQRVSAPVQIPQPSAEPCPPEESLAETDGAESSARIPSQVETPTAEPSLAETAGADAELAEIFLEESRELLDALDATLDRWRRNPDDSLPLADLQRTLHTLKGSARLAGLARIGDLGHAFESFLTGIGEQRIAVSGDVQRIAQQVADRLSAQVDEVGAKQEVTAGTDLIEKLESMLADAAGALASEQDLAGLEPEPAARASDLVGETADTDYEAEIEEAATADMPVPETKDTERLVVAAPSEAEIVRLFEEAEKQEQAVPSTGKPEVRVPAPAAPEEPQLPPKREQVRVRSDLLDRLVNNAGEVSIYRSRLEQQNSSIGFNLSELEQTVERLRQQLRQLEMETEAQILFRYEREQEERGVSGEEEFDPLELDRFSTMQQLSRSLMETVNDLVSIKDLTEDLHRDTETLLMQQARVATDLQEGLLRTRMVPFTQVVSRLQRVVRQTCTSMDKRGELVVNGTEVEVDRSILERIVAPLEHILRNAVSHGIEAPDRRRQSGKPEAGKISLHLTREGTDIVLTIADDGQGLKLDSIRAQALEKGLLAQNADVADIDVMQFILEPGFSTADEVSQISGRGVGMDVVASEVKQLGGSLEISSEEGIGTSFSIHLPLTLAISEALLVQMDEDIFAIPHTSIEGVVRIARKELQDCYEGRQDGFKYAGNTYLVRYLGGILGMGMISLPDGKKWFPMLLVRSGERRVALQVDGLLGNRQIVVKSVGPQLSTVRWITGGTILGDGRVALIVDVNALVRQDAAKPLAYTAAETSIITQPDAVKVMVVDDSITVRKVTGRLLERHNFQVITAKDGVDALALLQDHKPDLMLLDIEMPRMDGFELARHLRNSPELKHLPIIMITSRTGDKHRRLAGDLGVRGYLGKPYQEMELLDNIYSVLAETQV